MKGYDAYACPCGGSGENHDPTLTENVHRESQRTCPYCDGLGAVYVLRGFAPPVYAGALLREGATR